jgi:branched-chain amino acid transport system ATP-binding protein
VLELRELRVARGGAEVVHGVNLKVEQGELVGLVGPNGAGKSSVLRAMCGLLRPNGGEVRFAGQPLAGLAPEEIARRGLAMVPEGRQVFATLTVAENLRLAARGSGREAIERLSARFPILVERAGQRAERLSGGEQQQLAIARALVNQPRLLVLDEPSLGLAPRMVAATYELLAGLHEEGVTILLVEQNVARTVEFCERTLVLAGGRIRAEGSRELLQRNPRLLHAHLGRQL